MKQTPLWFWACDPSLPDVLGLLLCDWAEGIVVVRLSKLGGRGLTPLGWSAGTRRGYLLFPERWGMVIGPCLVGDGGGIRLAM
jgi:hypothetical protein